MAAPKLRNMGINGSTVQVGGKVAVAPCATEPVAASTAMAMPGSMVFMTLIVGINLQRNPQTFMASVICSKVVHNQRGRSVLAYRLQHGMCQREKRIDRMHARRHPKEVGSQ